MFSNRQIIPDLPVSYLKKVKNKLTFFLLVCKTH